MTSAVEVGARGRRLAAELRRLRTGCGLTAEDVGARMKWSKAKVSRIELYQQGVSVAELTELLAVYEVDPADVERYAVLVGGGAKSRRAGDEWDTGAEDREDASAVLEWGALTVPRLLQTGEYAQAVLVSTQAVMRSLPSEIARSVEATLRWQLRLAGEPPLALRAVVDEGALRRRYGSRTVMRAQLEHVLELGELPDVEVRVLPLASGGPAGVPAFRYVRFAPVGGIALADAVITERIDGEVRLAKEAEAFTFGLAFEALWGACGDEGESAELIERALRQAWS